MIKLRNLLFEFFDKSRISLGFVSKEECEQFIKDHYLGKPPSGVQDYIGIFHDNQLVGCVIYGAPSSSSMAKSFKNLSITTRDISELKRLFIMETDAFDKKGLASYSITHANQMVYDKRDVKLIVSYSDPIFHPNATVYRASNAIYQGKGKKHRWVYPMGPKKQRYYLRKNLISTEYRA